MFGAPLIEEEEIQEVEATLRSGWLGTGPKTKKFEADFASYTGAKHAIALNSCTAGLHLALDVLGVGPGDEVITTAMTFAATANVICHVGATPVFVDVDPLTQNIDPKAIEAAITPKTKAIVPVHYAGVGCDMDAIMAIAERHGLIVIEDAAQGLMSNYRGQPLGGIGHMAAVSFHETKNVISGEGGALLIRDPRFIERAEIIREKGTNRKQFFRGAVDKYTWVDIGSSYLPSEIIAAFLWAQMEDAGTITHRRLAAWDRYHAALEDLEAQGRLRRPMIPADCDHNAHMYNILLPDLDQRTRFIDGLKARGVQPVFHYVPLHTAPAGQRFARAHGDLTHTEALSDRLVRLPLWVGLETELDRVIAEVREAVLSLGEPVRAGGAG
ncbi:MAG: dTDP-4-amino-4,6-dideoxygalactose transaminase [Candidatus Sericytochromatia bacterium]